MTYLSFEEYLNMGGVLDLTAFNRNIIRACGIIDRDTHNRAECEETIPDYIKHLCCDLVEYFARNSVTENTVTSRSQSAGAVSESEGYATKTADDMEKDIENMLSDYLDGKCTSKGVLWRYRGAMC